MQDETDHLVQIEIFGSCNHFSLTHACPVRHCNRLAGGGLDRKLDLWDGICRANAALVDPDIV